MESLNGQKLQEHINREVEETLKLHTESLKVANEEMGLIKVATEGIKTDLVWLKKTYWIIAGASIGGLIAGLSNLILK